MTPCSNKALLGVAAVLAVSVAASPTAHAAAVAQAQIDWGSLQLDLIPFPGSTTPIIFVFTGESGSAFSRAYTVHPQDTELASQSAEDFETVFSVDSVTAEAQSSALRSSTLSASAASRPGTGAPAGFVSSNDAYAQARNRAAFTLSGPGVALISLDWSISGSGVQSDDTYAYSYAALSAYFSSDDVNFSSVGTTASGSTNSLGDYSFADTFTVAIFSSGLAPIEGYFIADVTASSVSAVTAVPVPAAGWLMGSALLGLLCVARRKA